MKELVKRMFAIEISSSIIYLGIGLLLFFASNSILKTISIILGIIIIIGGIIPIINYFKSQYKYNTGLIGGIVLLIIGLILVLNPSLLETSIAIIIGVVMIVNSVTKIEYSLSLRDNKIKEWKFSLFFAIITLLIGIFFCINSWFAINLITKTLGLIIIIYAIIDILEIFTIKTKMNKVIKNKQPKEKKIKIIEEKD